jgi:two-component system, OmpR family, sensor histidine kinase KdpD
MLELDAVLFEQVLFNLLDNAAKYAPAGTSISIRTLRDRDSILLQIIDEGHGIPQAELESIFDKFYRAQKGDHVRPGTGLGLAISRGFVEAMHGTISAANRSDRSGAVLTVRLPIPTENITFSSETETASHEDASEQETRASVLMPSEPNRL